MVLSAVLWACFGGRRYSVIDRLDHVEYTIDMSGVTLERAGGATVWLVLWLAMCHEWSGA